LDILGILNDYIKNNKSEKQLTYEIINLLNKGISIEKIAKQYEYTPKVVRNIIQNAGYTYNPYYQKWEQTKKPSQSDEKVETKEVINTDVMPLEDINESCANNNIQKPISGKHELKINLDIIVEFLNDGIEIEDIGNQFNISPKDLQDLLLKNGYQYYVFMNYWTKMNRQELCEYLVNELNKGVTMYDLSGVYVKNKKDRINFVSKLQELLKFHEYSYNFSTKKWEKKNVSQQLPTIVNELNKGVPIKEVAERFNVNASNLRLALKKYNFRYDYLFNIWTQDSRLNLVKELAYDLENEKVTLSELKEKGFDVTRIEVELKNSGFDFSKNREHKSQLNTLDKPDSGKISEDKTIEDSQINNYLIINQDGEKTSIEEQKNNPLHLNKSNMANDEKIYETSPLTQLFSSREVAILKEMIYHWEQKKQKEKNDSAEISIFINADLLKELTRASEMEGLSRSLIIEKALKVYLKP
jgi:uncharacterized protein (DUF433 family)